MKFETEELKTPNINLVPILDSIFILIFIFMFALVNSAKIQGLKVALPQTTASESLKTSTEVLAVEIRANQEVFFQGNLVTTDQLERELTLHFMDSPKDQVVIRGDRKADLQTTILVLDLIKKAGVRNVTIEAIKK